MRSRGEWAGAPRPSAACGRTAPCAADRGTRPGLRGCRRHAAPDGLRVGHAGSDGVDGAGAGSAAAPDRAAAAAGRGGARLAAAPAAGRPERVTAVGYHAVDNGALALEPVGEQANKGLFARLVRRLFGGDKAGLAWYQLGGEGPATARPRRGRPPGTDVYAPVDGAVVGISDYVISGKRATAHGSTSSLRASPRSSSRSRTCGPIRRSTVGAAVTASSSKLGTVIDFSRVERQTLARYTQDAGQPRLARGPPRRDAHRPLRDPLRRRRVRRAGPAGRRDAWSRAARGAGRRLLRRERRERRGRARDHAASSPRAARRGRRRDHAREPRLAPARDRGATSRSPTGSIRPANLSKHAPGAGLTVAERRGRARRSRSSTCSASSSWTPPHGPFEMVDELVEEARRRDAGHHRRLPRRGDEREGRDGALTSTAGSPP